MGNKGVRNNGVIEIRYGPNWTFVILFSVFLLPVGISLAVYKALKEKTRYKKNVKPLLITGFISCFYIAVGINACIQELSAPNLYLAIMFTCISIGYIFLGFLVNARGNRNIRYSRAIVSMVQSSRKNFVDISEIASQMKSSPEKAQAVIKEMIEEGFLWGIKVDYQKKQITWNSQNEDMPLQSAKPTKMVSVVCKQCGGVNKQAHGTQGVCEYCDSLL